MFSQFSDPYPLGSTSYSVDKHDYTSSSLSDNSTAASSQQPEIHSSEEVLLATSYPKKRAGRRIFKETRHPIYRGVRKRNNDKWVCELREPNKKSRIWLGTYPTPEMAARAYDVAALALRGKSACLNFADSAWKLPVPVSKEAKDIRIAAHEAAELFRPQETQKLEAEDGGEISCDRIQENVVYVDEEAVFDMPGYLADMAKGLLLSPPHYAGDHDTNWDDLETDIDMPLWSFSN